MTLLITDTTDLVEMRNGIDEIIRQLEAMNAEATERQKQFQALDLDDDMKQRVLDIIFADIESDSGCADLRNEP